MRHLLGSVCSLQVWDVNGWLSAHRPDPVLGIGMIDFGGSAVVHMSAGWCGFLGTLIIGPRIGRFDSNGEPVPIAGHSASLIVLGTYVVTREWGEALDGIVVEAGAADAWSPAHKQMAAAMTHGKLTTACPFVSCVTVWLLCCCLEL